MPEPFSHFTEHTNLPNTTPTETPDDALSVSEYAQAPTLGDRDVTPVHNIAQSEITDHLVDTGVPTANDLLEETSKEDPPEPIGTYSTSDGLMVVAVEMGNTEASLLLPAQEESDTDSLTDTVTPSVGAHGK